MNDEVLFSEAYSSERKQAAQFNYQTQCAQKYVRQQKTKYIFTNLFHKSKIIFDAVKLDIGSSKARSQESCLLYHERKNANFNLLLC
jgi:hypothetical protein